MLKYITTDGSILVKNNNFKKTFFLKLDKNNNFAWKSLLRLNTPNRLEKCDKFKIRFLK